MDVEIMNIEFWKATWIRCLRTFLTTILGVWTADKLVTEIDWKVTLISALSATGYIFVLCLLDGLPEVQLQHTLYSLDNVAPDEDNEEGDE